MNIIIAATKTNLLKVKKALAMTREGHELLEEKRKILMNELTSIINITARLERETDILLKEAYALLDKATVVMGRKRLEEISYSIDIKSDIAISQRRVMGVSIPVVSLQITEHPPYHSPYNVSFYVDETIIKFKEVLKLIAQLAEKKIALLRIAAEVHKTIRKVNALEKIYIPQYAAEVKFISDRLDEEGREAFSMLKLIKERLKQ